MENDVKNAHSQQDDSHQTKADGLLAATARKIGSAAAVVVSSLTGPHESKPPAEREHSHLNGRFPKKHKARLPRRQKKASRKAPVNA
jgi:hypothetical protein